MVGKLPLLAAAGLFVVGLVGFLLVGRPTPNWAVAPIVSPTLIAKVPATTTHVPTSITGVPPATPIELPPVTAVRTPTPTATPSSAVLAAGLGSLSPLGPIADPTDTPTPTPTATPTETAEPTPTATGLAGWIAKLLSPTATPTQMDIPPGRFTHPSVDPTPDPSATATPTPPTNTPKTSPSPSPTTESTPGHHRH